MNISGRRRLLLRPVIWFLLSSLICIYTISAQGTVHERGLADFGGDVGQYMSLLKGSSAFSFKPEDMTEEKRSDDENSVRTRRFPGFGRKRNMPEDAYEPKPEEIEEKDAGYHTKSDEGDGGWDVGPDQTARDSSLGDFGGDYGNYLKLLEGESALGFNPQPDPMSDDTDIQSDVFGGGISGKFWDMYKGSSSYDSLDEDDSEVAEELGLNEFDESEDLLRQTTEEDFPNLKRTMAAGAARFKDETYIVTFKPSKSKMVQLYDDLKSAYNSDDKEKMNKILDSLDVRKLFKKEENNPVRSSRKIMVINDDEFEDDSSMDESKLEMANEKFEEFVKKIKNSIPDPIETNKGLSSSYKNLTLYGVSKISTCKPVKKSFGNHWKGTVCLPNLSSMITSSSGPGVPFKGKVISIFKDIQIKMTFRLTGDGEIQVISVKTTFSDSKFVPTYDSSIPLNPWSKVSMSGYLVSKIKKSMPSIIDKTLLRLTHVVQNLDS
ncbi:uncharacterized protein [Lepeophtheirus salmonis]|nr:uncharacterized protein LOC121122112 isoform X2 [Lepeophtheirus salmonis]